MRLGCRSIRVCICVFSVCVCGKCTRGFLTQASCLCIQGSICWSIDWLLLGFVLCLSWLVHRLLGRPSSISGRYGWPGRDLSHLFLIRRVHQRRFGGVEHGFLVPLCPPRGGDLSRVIKSACQLMHEVQLSPCLRILATAAYMVLLHVEGFLGNARVCS